MVGLFILFYLFISTLVGLGLFFAIVREEVQKEGFVSRGDSMKIFTVCLCPLLNLLGVYVFLKESKNAQKFFNKPMFGKKEQ